LKRCTRCGRFIDDDDSNLCVYCRSSRKKLDEKYVGLKG